MKLTVDTMASMAQLFRPLSDDGVQRLKNELREEAKAAGVYLEATGDGLTLAQWEIIRNTKEILRAAVLAAGA